MKKIIFAALVVFGWTQVANADESRFYGGGGIGSMSGSGLSVTREEQNFLQSTGNNFNPRRTTHGGDTAGNVFIGYKFSPMISIEGGCLGMSDSTTETTASLLFAGGPIEINNGQNYTLPVTVTQRKKVSAWHLSVVSEKLMNDKVSFIGRIGVMSSTSYWEQRLAFGCPPGANCGDGYHGWASSSSKTSPLIGVGVAMKMTDFVSLRIEMMRSSALPSSVTMANMVVGF